MSLFFCRVVPSQSGLEIEYFKPAGATLIKSIKENKSKKFKKKGCLNTLGFFFHSGHLRVSATIEGRMD